MQNRCQIRQALKLQLKIGAQSPGLDSRTREVRARGSTHFTSALCSTPQEIDQQRITQHQAHRHELPEEHRIAFEERQPVFGGEP